MSLGQIGTIIILVLVIIIIAAIFIAFLKVRNKVREFSNLAFGTTDIIKGLKQADADAQKTPKSVSAATNIYLPSIMRDFPDFHYDEMKNRSDNLLISYLRGIEDMNASRLGDCTVELKDKLSMKIGMLQNEGKREHFQNIKIHRTEIRAYRKLKGRRSIIFQSAVQCYHWVEKDGKVISGSKERLEQSKYDVEMIYIQDRDLVENLEDAGLAMNCPNCGAPLPALGAKKCAYCDSPVVEFNIRTWNFSDVEKV